MKPQTLAALMLVAAGAAHAAQPIGVLKSVSGTVSVSGKGFVARAAEGAPVFDGSAVLVASNGRATLVLKNGCSVPLAASQHLVVDAALPCEQMQASVKQLFTPYRVAQAGIGQGLPGGAGAGTAGGAAGGSAGAAGAAAGTAGTAAGAAGTAAGAAGTGAAGAAAAGAAGAAAGTAAAGAAAAGAAAAGGVLSGLGAAVAGLGAAGTVAAVGAVAAVAAAVNADNNPVSAQ